MSEWKLVIEKDGAYWYKETETGFIYSEKKDINLEVWEDE